MKTLCLLLLICSIIDIGIAKPSKHFLIETGDKADVGGSGDGEHGVDYQYADYATFGDYASTVPTTVPSQGSPKNDLTLKVAKILADCDKDKSFDLTFEELKVCYVGFQKLYDQLVAHIPGGPHLIHVPTEAEFKKADVDGNGKVIINSTEADDLLKLKLASGSG